MIAAEQTWLGRPVPRVEDEALLRGRGQFIDDLGPVPHARHAALVRSPFAHARIGSIDVSAALALDGVYAHARARRLGLDEQTPGRRRLWNLEVLRNFCPRRHGDGQDARHAPTAEFDDV